MEQCLYCKDVRSLRVLCLDPFFSALQIRRTLHVRSILTGNMTNRRFGKTRLEPALSPNHGKDFLMLNEYKKIVLVCQEQHSTRYCGVAVRTFRDEQEGVFNENRVEFRIFDTGLKTNSDFKSYGLVLILFTL